MQMPPNEFLNAFSSIEYADTHLVPDDQHMLSGYEINS